jgi:hypothetical protein
VKRTFTKLLTHRARITDGELLRKAGVMFYKVPLGLKITFIIGHAEYSADKVKADMVYKEDESST